MEGENNIHIKLEIGKNPTTGELQLLTRFDTSAPNFTKDTNGFSWSPTNEERNFLNEAFDLMQKGR